MIEALNQDKIKEKCGVFGVFLDKSEEKSASEFAYYGMLALQHRGKEASGIAVSKDGKISAYYMMISTEKFVDFISKCKFIFDQPPFNGIKNLTTAFNDYSEVCLEFMFGEELLKERKRSFIGNKISALQQGADSIDETKRKYKGDAHVIHNSKVPCVQIFNIVPEFDGVLNYEQKQYMYSIHFPVKHSVYVKK